MVTKYTIEDIDKAIKENTIAKVLHMMIDTYIHGIYKDVFVPFRDKIRIAFPEKHSTSKSNSDIVISFADYDGTTVLLFGQNDPEYRISKTKYRYIDPVLPFVIFTQYEENKVDRFKVYNKLSNLIQMIIDNSGINVGVITIYLDMTFDEDVKFTDVLDDIEYDGYNRIAKYALDEIDYKFKNKIPIEYKFANHLKLNCDDQDYEAVFDMNMYIYGVYDHKGKYSIMIMYTNRDPENNFDPEYDAQLIDKDQLRKYVGSYINTFKKVLTNAFIPNCDMYSQNVLERVY